MSLEEFPSTREEHRAFGHKLVPLYEQLLDRSLELWGQCEVGKPSGVWLQAAKVVTEFEQLLAILEDQLHQLDPAAFWQDCFGFYAISDRAMEQQATHDFALARHRRKTG